ncbi:MAG: hypothetical protein R2819_11495 [Allomuricauda sp.]
MKKIILAIFYLILLTNCSKEGQNNSPTEPNGNEDGLPQISISNVNDLIEKTTNFRISISGISEQTKTTVFINEDEVVSTSQKNFDFVLNPFDYPNGNSKLMVKSVASGKESVKSEEFEIKKLLFRSFGGLSSTSVDSYLAINLQSTGELVAFKKIVTYDDPIFFHAEDSFIEENIIVTQYLLGTNSSFHVARMYGNVQPGTELISIQQIVEELGLDFITTNKSSSFDITVEGTSNSGLFSLLGRNYSFGSSAFPVLEINLDQTLASDVFLYYLNQFNEDILNNYRYAYIDDLANQTLQFDEMSSLQPTNIQTLELPETVDRATISLYGFANEDEYREDMFRLLFLNGIETASSGHLVSYPILEQYPITVKRIGLELSDGNMVLFEQKGTPNVTIPNLTIQRNATDIEITGEHDFSELNLVVSHPDPANNETFRMIYKNASQDVIDIPFERLEIPAEIVAFLTERGLEIGTRNNMGPKELRIYNYENKVFPNGVFHFPLRREYGDAVQWTFPIEN